MGDKRKLFTVFKELGGFNLETLRDRKIFQKRLYFLQEFGLDLGYDFNFYMYGPYSRNATEDAFSLHEQKIIAPLTIRPAEISDTEYELISKFKEFLKEIPDEKQARKLELLSSLHYLSNLAYLKKRSRKKIEQLLNKMKPQMEFSDLEIKQAWSLLEKFRSVNS